MDTNVLQEHIANAQSNATFFHALGSDPASVIPGFEKMEEKVKSGMASVTNSGTATGPHAYGRYEACTSTSCGCGGSI